MNNMIDTKKPRPSDQMLKNLQQLIGHYKEAVHLCCAVIQHEESNSKHIEQAVQGLKRNAKGLRDLRENLITLQNKEYFTSIHQKKLLSRLLGEVANLLFIKKG